MNRILLAVSGGVDSMYLLEHAAEYFPGAHFAVAHCNFSLRGAESDEDEEFVRKECSKRSFECFVKRFNTTEYAQSKDISIEMAARELRYGWFAELCKEKGFDALAVAHNANDNAETMILNLVRGTGSKGLCGMSQERVIDSLTILRPMLNLSRREIEQWMKDRGLSWREDSSNSSFEYKRNIVRGKVFPVFEQLNPSFLDTLREDMQRIREVDAIAEEYCTNALEQIVDENGHLSAEKLLTLKHWEFVLQRFAQQFGTSGGQIADLVEFLKKEDRSGFAGKRFGPLYTGPGYIGVAGCDTPPQDIEIQIVPRSEIKELKQNGSSIIMDASKLAQPLVVRPWREGDWFCPLGMKGMKKKLSDLFVDLKWDLERKSSALVVELDGAHIAALLFERVDEQVKVTSETTQVLRITAGCPTRKTSSNS